MAVRDCTTHTHGVRVSLDSSKLEGKQHSNIIAAQLRQLADYTDGWCSTEHAHDADLQPRKSMHFYFTTEEKRSLFKNRIALYLRADINRALTRLDG